MLAKHLIPRVAAFCLLLMAAAAFGGQPQWAATFALGALAAAVWLGVGLAKTRPRDPYDLSLLREIHEQSQSVDEESGEVEDDAGIICPHCGNVYAAWIPVCPRCKRSSHVAPF